MCNIETNKLNIIFHDLKNEKKTNLNSKQVTKFKYYCSKRWVLDGAWLASIRFTNIVYLIIWNIKFNKYIIEVTES